MFVIFYKYLFGILDINFKGLRILNVFKVFTLKFFEFKNVFIKIVVILKGKFIEKKVLW